MPKKSPKKITKSAAEKPASQELVLVGRGPELAQLRACLRASRNVLLEGPVGVGKTHLALAVARELGLPVFRIDGDNRYSEQKLSGWFDPPMAIKKGFVPEAFVPGPLVEAMRVGGTLLINEMNRLPEGVQNVLLPAIDERLLLVPRFGSVHAHPAFRVIATQNPKEFVATSHLSEALLDRFELVGLDYQSEKEECEIVTDKLSRLDLGDVPGKTAGKNAQLGTPFRPEWVLACVRLARMTRNHPRVRRGASVRAAIAVAEISAAFVSEGRNFRDAFLEAALIALPTRIELERDADSEKSQQSENRALLREWVASALEGMQEVEKKKTVN